MRLEVVSNRNKKISVVLFALVILMIMSSSLTQFNMIEGLFAVPNAFAWMLENFVPNTNALSKLPTIIDRLIETLALSIAATTTGGICALFLSFLGSKTTAINGFFSVIARLIATIFRNIPDAVWAMIFLLSFGQNVLTGYFALFFASFGILTRAFIETIDEASSESVEALKATGASYMQIIFQGVIPDSIGQLISWVLYMIETNIRSSTLIGMLTGTGIGFTFDLYYKSMNYSAAGLVVVLMTVAILIIEFISNFIRRRIQ